MRLAKKRPPHCMWGVARGDREHRSSRDSEILTAIDTLPGNGDEAANAAELVREEQTAHGNQIQALSIDSVAFQGPVLEQLQAPEGLGLDLYVPPKPETPRTGFPPEAFREERS